MSQFNILKGTVGWVTMYSDIITRSSLSESDQDTVRYRVKVLDHFKQFGLASTMNAFDESKATLYRWNKQLTESKGNIYTLVKKSTKPHHYRKSSLPESVINYIVEHKLSHPKLGKDKISHMIQRDLSLSVSPTTVHRIITDLKSRGGRILRHSSSDR